MLRRIRQSFVQFWLNSTLFHWIDQLVSTHFRKRLKNHDFTILSSNCVGGILYHRLGERFLSPTINLWIKQPDFVQFCVHLDHYLQQKLQFVESAYSYPVGQLAGIDDDANAVPPIKIYFNHASSAAEAEEKWETRKKRIQRDNLFIILYKLDGITNEELKKLENVHCRNKVVLTSTPIPEINWAHYIKPNMRQQYPYSYLGKNIFGLRRVEQKFDFVNFLNAGE